MVQQRPVKGLVLRLQKRGNAGVRCWDGLRHEKREILLGKTISWDDKVKVKGSGK